MAARRILVDTNVLLTATVSDRELHSQAARVFVAAGTPQNVLFTCGQVLREYLVVSTRPRDRNGFGLPPKIALDNLERLAARMRFLPEGQTTAMHLRRLVLQYGCQGKNIHDANLVAIALGAQLDSILTANSKDFQRFEDHIKVQDLATWE